MEGSGSEALVSLSSKPTFWKHMFSFDADMRADMLNIMQYALIALIPIILLNKLTQAIVPEADETKGSVEIFVEVILQIMVMFLGLYFILRFVTFFPTYSGVKYVDGSITFIILSTLMITLSLQTKLGEKVSILVDRVKELWEGKKEDEKDARGKKGSKKGAGTGAGGQGGGGGRPVVGGGAVYADTTSLHNLPISGGAQTTQDFNSMYRNDANPMVGAASPQSSDVYGYNEPMPANLALGNSFNAW